MKTRNIFALLAALTLVAGFTGCKSEEELEAKPAKEILMVLSGDVIQYRSNETGPSTDINVSADCRWTVELDAGNFGDDISVSPRQGNGNGSLVITSNQNTTPGLLREAIITLVSDGGLRQKVTVRQTGGDDALNISSTSFTFGATSTEAQLLTITSNTEWEIVVPNGYEWLHFDKTRSTDGAGPVQITVDNAVSDAQRTAPLAVTYGTGGNKKSIPFEVTQEGMTNIYLRAPERLSNFSWEGGEATFNVECNAGWNAYVPSSVSWLRVEPAQGVGNGEIRVFCDENRTVDERLTAIVIISGSKDPKQSIVLIQQNTSNSQSSTTTLTDLTSLYVYNTSAEFRFSFVSDAAVGNYGLVYSTTNREPTVGGDNCQTVVVGEGYSSKNVLAELENLQETTTYYVRAFAYANTDEHGYVYSPNMVTITTSSHLGEPGESDNPDPQLAPGR